MWLKCWSFSLIKNKKCWLPTLATFHHIVWKYSSGRVVKTLNSLFDKKLTLSQTTNFRLFQTETVCRRQFLIWWKWQKGLQAGKKHCGKKRILLVTSNFSFSHSVFKRLELRTRENQGLFGKGLTCLITLFHFAAAWIYTCLFFCMQIDDSDCDRIFLSRRFPLFRLWLWRKSASTLGKILCEVLVKITPGKHG